MMRTVREVMQKDVITLPPETTARDLARTLEEQHVSGVPVCDHTGRVLGVVSATDLVRLEAENGAEPLAPELDDEWQDDDTDDGAAEEDENESASWSWFIHEEPPPRFVSLLDEHGPDLDEFTVSEIMTREPYSISPDATLADLARMLLEHGIHRALVVENDHLVGIVTTFDVLRTLVEAEATAVRP